METRIDDVLEEFTSECSSQTNPDDGLIIGLVDKVKSAYDLSNIYIATATDNRYEFDFPYSDDSNPMIFGPEELQYAVSIYSEQEIAPTDFRLSYGYIFDGNLKWMLCFESAIMRDWTEEECEALRKMAYSISGFLSTKDIRDKAVKAHRTKADLEEKYRSQMELMEILADDDKDPRYSISQIIKIVAGLYEADRAYVFEVDRLYKVVNNTYEWCNYGMKSLKSIRQNISVETLRSLLDTLAQEGAIEIEDLETDSLYPNVLKELFWPFGISSTMVLPLIQANEYIGFFGITNPKRFKSDLKPLKIARGIIQMEIMKTRENDKEHLLLEKLVGSFTSSFFVNFDTDYFRIYHIIAAYEDFYGRETRYSSSMEHYISNNVAEQDRQRVMHIADPRIMKQKLLENEKYTIAFHDNTSDINFVELTFQRINDTASEAVLYGIDRSESDRKQRKLEEDLLAAQNVSRSKSEFLFNVSHDIRTLLSSIIGFTDMAEKHQDDVEKRTDSLRKVREASRKMTDILNGVLEKARIESANIVIENELSDAKDFYDSVITLFEGEVKRKNLFFSTGFDIAHRYLYIDKTHLTEVFISLINNAVRLTPEGGSIKLDARELPGRNSNECIIETVIQDNGTGLSEDDLDNELSSGVTGIGLSIVKNLVELMDGTIRIESKTNAGTTVTLRLPHMIGRISQMQWDDGLIGISKAMLKGKSILLAEDNDLNAEIAIGILSEAGISVDRAEDGQVCLEKIKDAESNRYDAVLMDIQMPNMDGYRVTHEIRRLNDPLKSSIPIVAMTANASKEDADKALMSGMNGHIAKPVDVNKLMKVLSDILK